MLYEETFTLSVTPRFRLDLTAWALRRRRKNRVDWWDGKRYSRVFVIDNKVSQVVVEQKTETELVVIVKSKSHIKSILPTIVNQLQRMLGTVRKLEEFYQLAKKDRYLKPLAEMLKGVKPPRFPTIFESLINSIACQQVTLDLGILLLNRLAENFGMKFEGTEGIQYAFPRPEDLYKISEEDIKKLGFSYQKARAIIALSQAIIQKKLSLTDMEDVSNEEIVNRLLTIRGIGRWSAEYALLRGFGRLDTFPGDDVGAQNNLKRIFHLDTKPTYEEIKKLTSKWQPYAGLVYFHLLLEKLQGKGLI